MGNKIMFYGFGVLICIFFESLTCAIYLSRLNLLKDIIWALPISSVTGIMGLFLLDYYQEERRKEKVL